MFQLAANMGTSVEMIESFYGKKANAGSEDGNGSDEIQGKVIKVCMLTICLFHGSGNEPSEFRRQATSSGPAAAGPIYGHDAARLSKLLSMARLKSARARAPVHDFERGF